MKKLIVICILVLIFLSMTSLAFAADYNHYEDERPHVPTPYYQRDVALGIGISTVGIVILNSLTSTSVFGTTSFNTGALGSQAAPSPSPQAAASQSSGVINSVKKFFVKLISNLRDMLTDEGRSYASGKVADVLVDIKKED